MANHKREVIDIIPPRSFEESPHQFSERKRRIFPFEIYRKRIFYILGILLVLLAVYSFSAAKAEVFIIPEMKKFSSEIVITVDKDAKEVDLFANIVPGYFLEETNSLSRSFSSSGKVVVSQKAKGIIRVYNDYSAVAQPLRANTRFMAASGEIFRTPTRIVVPGKRIENGKEVPGYIDVKVVADQPGEEYNIEPTTFSIPGLVGTPLYTKFYGKSFEPMKGGFRGEVSQVTKEDIKKAQDSVIKTLKEEGKKVIEKKTADYGGILLKEALLQEVQATSCPSVGTKVDKFEFEARARSIALIFKRNDIEKIIANQIPEGKKIVTESLILHWDPQTIDLESGKMVINLKFSGNIYAPIDLVNLKEEIVGKSISEAKRILEEKKEILQANIKIRPFWRRRLPSWSKKVELRLDFSQKVD